jgi:hypothetical protein
MGAKVAHAAASPDFCTFVFYPSNSCVSTSTMLVKKSPFFHRTCHSSPSFPRHCISPPTPTPPPPTDYPNVRIACIVGVWVFGHLRLDAELILFQGHCFNHLRNTWFEPVELCLSRKVTDLLRDDLESIPLHLRASCKLGDLLRQVDKEYSFTANYFKGSGDEYSDWKERFRPGKRYLPGVVQAWVGQKRLNSGAVMGPPFR